MESVKKETDTLGVKIAYDITFGTENNETFIASRLKSHIPQIIFLKNREAI